MSLRVSLQRKLYSGEDLLIETVVEDPSQLGSEMHMLKIAWRAFQPPSILSAPIAADPMEAA